MNHIQMVEHFEDFWFRIVGRASCNQTYTDLCKKKERKKERKEKRKKESNHYDNTKPDQRIHSVVSSQHLWLRKDWSDFVWPCSH